MRGAIGLLVLVAGSLGGCGGEGDGGDGDADSDSDADTDGDGDGDGDGDADADGDGDGDGDVHSDARECWERNPAYPDDMDRYLEVETWCSEFVSRFDGQSDVIYLHFPPDYDPAVAVPVFFWFRALYQSEGILSDPVLHAGTDDGSFPGVPGLYDAIVVGVGQRGDCSFLGDYWDPADPNCQPSDEARAAASEDVAELTNQMTSRFLVSHFFAVGASMGGYVPLRLNQLYPDRFSGALASAPAICAWGDSGPPDCGGPLGDGPTAVYDAAEAGVLDDKLVWVAVGTRDDVEGLLAGDRHLETILRGRPWFRYSEVEGAGHENFFTDDYNLRVSGEAAWLVDNPAVPTLEEDIRDYLDEHSGGDALDPEPGWTPPDAAHWYMTDRILERGGRPFVSGPAQ